jgi:hypothetical protein
VIWSFGTLGSWPLIAFFGAMVMIGAAAMWGLFLVRAIHRAASPMDVLAQQITTSALALPVAAALAGAALIARAGGHPLPARITAVVGLLLLGVWLCGLIVAVSGRLIPRLAAMQARRRQQTPVQENGHVLAIGGWGVIGGLLLLTLATAAAQPALARMASVVMTGGSLVLAWHQLKLVRVGHSLTHDPADRLIATRPPATDDSGARKTGIADAAL